MKEEEKERNESSSDCNNKISLGLSFCDIGGEVTGCT